MGTDVEKFLGASVTLANRNNLPARQGRQHEQFNASEFSKIVFGQMLAQVAIVPMPIDSINLISYDGDEEMLRALRSRVEGRTLKLEGQIPFKPGGSRHSFGSGMVFGDLTISGGSFSSYSSGNGDVIVINGREVDLDRAIQLVLMVPSTMDLKFCELIGAVGITDHLDATLDFSQSVRADLKASSVQSLIGDISGSGKVTLESVVEDAELEISGSGSFNVGSVGGVVQAKITGSGNIVVNGGSSSRLRASVSGSGNVWHNGTVTGDARLRVSGGGHVTAAHVNGEVDSGVTGTGSVTANGHTYRPRRQY